MIDYRKWARLDRKAKGLLLDPLNPRLPNSGSHLTQEQVLHEMIEHEDVADLAKNIAKHGYFPIESLVGVHDGSDTVITIIEGNRRLAAVKLLLEPELAPPSRHAYFKKLAMTVVPEVIEKVELVLAPDRDSAITMIYQKHTQGSVKRWISPQQYRAVARLVAGRTLEEIAAMTGLDRSRVEEAVRGDILYTMARKLDLSEKVKAQVMDEREFPITTLSRLFESTAGKKHFKAKLDVEKGLSIGMPQAEFDKSFKHVVGEIATRKIDSRAINKDADIDKYLKGLPKASQPDTSKKGTFTVDVSGHASTDAESPTSAKAKPTPPRQSSSILPTTLRCNVKNERIQDVFKELRRVNVGMYPNSSAFLLRVLIDLSAQYFAVSTGQMDGIRKIVGKEPSLTQILKTIEPAILARIPAKAGHERFKQAFHNDNHPLSLRNLNGFVHSEYHTPNERELRGLSRLFSEVLEILWTPEQTTEPKVK